MKRDSVLGRPGNDLLSRVLRHSTIGAEEFNGRVRDGIGFWAPRSSHRAGEGQVASKSGSREWRSVISVHSRLPLVVRSFVTCHGHGS